MPNEILSKKKLYSNYYAKENINYGKTNHLTNRTI